MSTLLRTGIKLYTLFRTKRPKTIPCQVAHPCISHLPPAYNSGQRSFPFTLFHCNFNLIFKILIFVSLSKHMCTLVCQKQGTKRDVDNSDMFCCSKTSKRPSSHSSVVAILVPRAYNLFCQRWDRRALV